jgi:hypothetical protein
MFHFFHNLSEKFSDETAFHKTNAPEYLSLSSGEGSNFFFTCIFNLRKAPAFFVYDTLGIRFPALQSIPSDSGYLDIVFL